jgi:hypothetical protein
MVRRRRFATEPQSHREDEEKKSIPIDLSGFSSVALWLCG